MTSSLLTPASSVLVMVDYQSQMFLGVGSHPQQTILNNAIGLGKAARAFDVPVVVTTVNEKGFSGPMPPALAAVFSDTAEIDRTTMNPWEDARVVAAVTATKRRQVVFAGLWTEVCIAMPVVSAIEAGFDAFVVADACGGTTREAHETSLQRMVQAGARPITWLVYMLELQRDWARAETARSVAEIAIAHAGGYGIGMHYYMSLNPDAQAKG
jgi:nicotinamidase-related amidase